MATETFKAYTATLTTILSTELNSLASSASPGTFSSAASTVLDNTSNLDLFADFEFNGSFGTGPTAGTGLDLYLVPTIDGTNYEDGGGAVAPSTAYYVGTFIVRSVTTAQKIAIRGIQLGPTKFKAVLANNNTGQSLAASGNTVGFRSYSLTIA